jgi:hypothetical protein
MTTFYRLENRRRNKLEGGEPIRGAASQTMTKFDLAPGELSFRVEP